MRCRRIHPILGRVIIFNEVIIQMKKMVQSLERGFKMTLKKQNSIP
jgi:hypothetical protein